MKRLEKILQLLQDPKWVTRPETDIGFEEDLAPDQAKAMAAPVAKPPAPARTAPLSADQLDINLGGTPNTEDKPQEPVPTESKARRRLMHAAAMDEMAKQQNPRSRPMKSLAGGGYGTGIF